jgi:hypothetical protein
MHSTIHAAAMSRNATRAAGVAVVALILLVGTLAPHLASAQGSGGATSAQLQSEIQIASSGLTYSSGLLSTATARGLSVASALALIGSGNSSLAAARAALSSGGDATVGSQDAQASAQDFNAAADILGIALEGSGLTAYANFGSAAGAIASANATTTAISTTITNACATIPVNSTLSSAFEQDCSSAKADVSASLGALSRASVEATGAESGKAGASLSASAALVTQARGNLSQAAAVLGALSTYTYGARGEAFTTGPMANEAASANASVLAQEALVTQYASVASGFQSYSAGLGGGVDAVTSSANAALAAVSSVDPTSVASDASAQEANLAAIQSNLALLGQQLPDILPSNATGALDDDVAAAQAALTPYASDVANVETVASAFSQASVSGFPAYSTSFQSASAPVSNDAQAFLSSYASLQVDLESAAGAFPLLTELSQWSGAMIALGQSAASGSDSLDTSLQAMGTGLTLVGTDISSLTTAIQSSLVGVQVSAALVQEATAVSSSEAGWLNSTGAATVAAAATSLQTTASLASSFTASSQALLQLQLGQITPAVQSVASQGSLLDSQVTATSAAMSPVGAVILGDIQARIQAVASAKALIVQALPLLEGGQVSQGAGLLLQASAELQMAYSRAA